MKKKKFLKILTIILFILFILLVPRVDIVADGGTRIYRSLVYKITKYNQLDIVNDDGTIRKAGRKDTVIKFFPHNFSLED